MDRIEAGERDRPGQATRDAGRAATRWLMGLARRERASIGVAVAAALMAGLLLVPQAVLLARILHDAIVRGAAPASLAPLIFMTGGLLGARVAITLLGDVAGKRAAESIKARLRTALFGHMLGQYPDWTAARSSGALAAAVVDQLDALDGFFARYLPALIAAVVLPVAFAGVVLSVEPVVGLLFLATAPLIPVFMALVGWGAEAASRRHQRAFAQLSGFFADRLRGLVTLKLFGRAEAEIQTLRAASDELNRRTLGVLRIAFLSSAVLEFFAALGIAGVALYVGLTYLGFLHVWSRPLTLELGLFCLLMAPEVYLPLRQFAAHYHDRAAAKAAVAGLTELFGALPDVSAAPGRPERSHAPRAGALGVRAADLTMQTPDGARPVLSHANFAIAARTHVAVMGASGSGKSTMLEALGRLRAFTGSIELDGRALGDIAEAELRERVAVLGQRPRLFHGTIATNIRVGCPAASNAQVRDAAARAGVMEFAASLPDGLDTRVGDAGLGLSGGEAQRVALARIYLRRPGLILLDEPTAHLDAETEQRVIDGLLDFARGRTLVVVTHSRAVAERMDRILRVEGEKILASPHRRKPTTAFSQESAA